MEPEELRVLDSAMMRLRRVWAPPPASERATVPDRERSAVELSTVLVVETCARAIEAGIEASVADVAAFAGVAPSTASRFVRRPAEARMVQRAPAPGDGRRAAVRLTAAGRELHARARDFRLQRLALVIEDWKPDEIAKFAVLLDRFARGATDPEHGAPLVPSPNPT